MNNKESLLKKPAVQTLMSSLICIVVGLLVGFIVLLAISPSGAGKAITTILLNFLTKNSSAATMKALGATLTKTAPLLMCALSICFCYKVGLFNIGAAGQYEAGACAAIYCALVLKLPWFLCLIAAAVAGAIVGAIIGFLKAQQNVNEVISGIMLNWIMLYICNMILSGKNIKDPNSPYTLSIANVNPSGNIPNAGISAIFGNKTCTWAIVLAVIFAVIIWIVLTKTKFGYELVATGYNKNAAKYAGMKEKQNIIVTLAIGGALAGIGASFMFLVDYAKWETTITSVPGMGFSGIAATFLGGLHPLGTIFSSFFIQNITDGGSMIDRMVYPSQISDLIAGIIIYLCGFTLFFKYIMNKKSSAQLTGNVNDVKTEGGKK